MKIISLTAIVTLALFATVSASPIPDGVAPTPVDPAFPKPAETTKPPKARAAAAQETAAPGGRFKARAEGVAPKPADTSKPPKARAAAQETAAPGGRLKARADGVAPKPADTSKPPKARAAAQETAAPGGRFKARADAPAIPAPKGTTTPPKARATPEATTPETTTPETIAPTESKSESDTEPNPTRISGVGAHNIISDSNHSGGIQIGNNILNGAFSNSLNGVLGKPDSKTTPSTTTPSDSPTSPETTSPSTGSGGDIIKVNPTTVSGNDAGNIVDNSNHSGGIQIANNIGNGLGSNTGNNLAGGLVPNASGVTGLVSSIPL